MLVRDKIVMERQRQGISRTELGAMVGVNRVTINRYENGVVKRIPTDVLSRIVAALHSDFDEFVIEDPLYCNLASRQGMEKYQQQFSEEDRMLIE